MTILEDASMTEAKLQRVRIGDLKPNPFRDIDNYQLNEEKVEALMSSIDVSGWWANILVRERPGGPELAYGHHRIEALRRMFGDDYKAQVLVKDLSDDNMLRLMVQENLTIWGGGAATMLENVRATVKALAEGKLAEFPEVAGDTPKQQIRYAPSFQMNGPAARRAAPSYTAAAIAKYHGITDKRGVQDALATLEAIERRDLEEKDLLDLTDVQAREIGRQVTGVRRDVEERVKATEKALEDAPTPGARKKLERKLEKERKLAEELPRQTGKQLTETVRKRGRDNVSRDDIRQEGAKVRTKVALPKRERKIDCDAVVAKITNHLYDVTREDHPAMGALVTMASNLNLFSPAHVRRVLEALHTAADRIDTYIGSIEPMTDDEAVDVEAEVVSELPGGDA